MPKRNRTLTTTLPPTLIEAEAIEFARRDIAFVREGKLKLFGVLPGKWFESNESGRACRLMYRDLVLSDATHRRRRRRCLQNLPETFRRGAISSSEPQACIIVR
jgi:hypothetical protein